MNTTSIGDLAQSFMARNRNAALKQDINRLTQELSSGQVADVRNALAGNYSYLSEVERKLEVLGSYKTATTEASIFSRSMQAALEQFESTGEQLANTLVVTGASSIGSTANDTAAEAKTSVEKLIGTLNTRVAGRSIFSGTATNMNATASADDLLAALSTAMMAATTPAAMFAAAQLWFDDPAGFDTLIYQGSSDGLAPVKLSDQDQVTLDVKATDPKLKDMLRLASVAALADDPAFGLSIGAQNDVFLEAGTALLGARDNIISVRARVGFAESRIEQISTRNAAEATSIGIARNALLAVDPFETATKLEDVQFQLQSLYAVTVRMSQLSLVNFL